jgi:protocatechuate 3,4-dioxygenase beta subunit
MARHCSVTPLPRVLASLAIILIACATATTKPWHPAHKHNSAPVIVTLNLADFGATGDGVTDDGPAFQGALDALAAAGGGTLLVPAGTYLISTPVVKDFSTLANGTITIQGVPSSTMPAPVTATGQELAAGLDLTSEIIAATGPNSTAFTLTNAQQLTIEHIAFLGRPSEMTDAFITLFLVDIGRATIRHCEFYGLSSFGLSAEHGAGNIVRAVRSDLAIELSVFLGCTANSGAYGAVVENLLWRKFSISNSIFLDYGIRPGFFSKTGLGAPLSWIDIGNAAEPTPDSPRREFLVRDTFLDEGGWVGITAFPYRWGPYAKIDLVYISGLKMNVSNTGTAGHVLYDIENILIENSRYGWSQNAYAAIDINRTANAIFDRLTCIDHADRLHADAGTGRFTVINSQYAGLDSEAQMTTVLETTPEDDPVQYVRQQFLSVLGRQPDPAAHFYWSDLLIRCGEDINCRNQKRAELQEYLATTPNASFTLQGTAVDENGAPLSDVAVLLSGSQSTSTVTDAQGNFRFLNLPTSGTYTVAVSKEHYSFPTSSQTVVRPANDVVFHFDGLVDRHSISGQITRPNGTPVGGVTVQLDGTATAQTTDANGYYSFSGLADGQDYTVVPVSTEFEFTPSTKTIQGLSADRSADFSASRTIVTIVGTVADENGTPVSGATINLTGSQTAVAITDAQGGFQFSRLAANGNYNVAASKQYYSFVPASHSVSTPDENVSISFAAQLNRHSINGRITNHNGAGVSGVAVSLNPSAEPQTTDANGYYSFTQLPAGVNYTVIPSSSDYDFTPASISFESLSANQIADFIGNPRYVSLDGSVVDEDGRPISGATVNLSGTQSASAITNLLGEFHFQNLLTTGSYTVTVSKHHYTFAIASRTINQPQENVTVEFNAQLNRHSISGRVTRANGSAVSGVTVSLSQSSVAPITTDSNGFYSFANLAAGQNYTVVASSTEFSFTPGSVSLQDLGADQTANFSANLLQVSITINVVDENGAPLDGATIAISGSHSASAQTDSQGRARFSSLPTTGSYTLSVSKQHYTFTTSSQNFDHPTDNVSITFSGRLNRHSIRGRITQSDGAGLGGVIVRLGQAGTISAITDTNGYYSFSDLPAGGNYTILPVSTDYSFAPFEKSFQDLGSDQVADFTAKLAPVILTVAGTETAVALESILLTPEPFSVLSPYGFSVDGYTRIMIFAKNLEQIEPPAQTSLVAEDDLGNLVPLTIESISVVRGQSWLKQINVKLSPSLVNGRCVKLQISSFGTNSNKARICIGNVSP